MELQGETYSVANAYLADLTSEEERNKNYGRMSVASNLDTFAVLLLQGFWEQRSTEK
jgi:hypothetical protein